MSAFREFAFRLVSLRNVAPIVIIAVAVMGSTGVRPFGVEVTSDQIIMALLAFLAIDSLVERLEILTNIERGIQSALRLLSPRTSIEAFFKRRRDYPRMEQLISEARQEIWISGFNLSGTAALSASLRRRLEEGCRIRFMAHDPTGDAFPASAKYYVSAKDPELAFQRIATSLTALKSLLGEENSSLFEVRVLDRVFPTGYFVIDPNTTHARMIIQSHLYQTQTDESPLFDVSKTESPHWFAVYLNQFELAWKDAKPF